MRRITVSLDDALVDLAEAEVAAGRAPSVSAWVANAIRAKAQARTELVSELEDLERREPTPAHVVESIARSLDLAPTTVARALRQTRARRAG